MTKSGHESDADKRRRLRAALDQMAPEPGSIADRGDESTSGGAPSERGGGLPAEDLERERPPHHGG